MTPLEVQASSGTPGGPAAGPGRGDADEPSTLGRQLTLLGAAVKYELRKASAFRTGFLLREILRGVARPAVMVLVFIAIFRGQSADGGLGGDGLIQMNGWTLSGLIHYTILVATFQKFLFHERALDLAEQIFEGYVTKYLVMPIRYFTLALGRFVQYSVIQAGVALLFFTAGLVLLPAYWPRPVSALAALEACTLVVLGSACFFELYFLLNALAFWLDVVWSLLVMARFVTLFVSGWVIPISLFPEEFVEVFRWLFHWSLSAPIEIFLGRLGHADFLRGLLVLLVSLALLEGLRAWVWKRGSLRYTGSGM